MDTKIPPKYFFFTLLILAIAFTLVLFRPFLTVIILSASLALVFSPIYKWLQSKMTWQSGWLSSVLTILLFVVILCGPLFFVGKLMFQQSTDLYQSLTSTYDSNEFLENLEIKPGTKSFFESDNERFCKDAKALKKKWGFILALFKRCSISIVFN